MTERTINLAELTSALAVTQGITHEVYRDVLNAAFPPIFKPKEGEIIVVSQHESFKDPKIRVFCYIDDDNEYVCFMNGSVENTTTVCFMYAKPQTPTQKGE
jgi:hypothetical protein